MADYFKSLEALIVEAAGAMVDAAQRVGTPQYVETKRYAADLACVLASRIADENNE